MSPNQPFRLSVSKPANLQELQSFAKENFWPHNRMAGDVSPITGLDLVVRGEGVWVENVEGRRFFDTMAGLWLVNAGHGRKEIADAVHQQMTSLAFTPPGTVSPVVAEVSAKVMALSPHPDGRMYWMSGGTEAVETALKIARKYHKNRGQPSRTLFLARQGSYHGNSLMTMALSKAVMSSVADFEPLPEGTRQCAQPGVYRCGLCAGQGLCNLKCADDVERAILEYGPDNIAAFIGEPISATAGIHDPGPDYWRRVQEICNRHGVLFILDEVITGFGRTGKMFALQHWGLKPDLITIAKGLTSGYVPVGAVLVSKDVSDTFLKDDASVFRHVGTFGGNPISAAAASANLKIFERENLVGNAEKMGALLLEGFRELKRHAIVGDVRGKGLLCAIEFVKDQQTKERFPAASGLVGRLGRLMRQTGLYGRGGDVWAFSPPLCIQEEEVEWLVKHVDQVVSALSQELLQ